MTRNSTKPSGEVTGGSGSRGASPILRGAFVHRMGENLEDEHIAAKFWMLHGCAVEGIEDPSERFSRRPDLRLLRDGVPWAYCEVKTIWHHRWSVHILHQDHEEVRTQLTDKSVEERILGDLVTAERQLRAENPEHAVVNVVLLVNRDSDASISVLSRVLTGKASGSRRSPEAHREGRLAEEVQRFRRNVDLCVWAVPANDSELLVEGCYLFNPSLLSFAEEIAGMRKERIISLEPAA